MQNFGKIGLYLEVAMFFDFLLYSMNLSTNMYNFDFFSNQLYIFFKSVFILIRNILYTAVLLLSEAALSL